MTLRKGPSTLASSPAHISSNWPLGTHGHRLLIDSHTLKNGVRQADECWVPLKVISNYINKMFNLYLAITALFNILSGKKRLNNQ